MCGSLRKKVFKEFGKNLEEPMIKLKLSIPDNLESNLKNYNITAKNEPLKILKWMVLNQNLMQGPCIGCGAASSIEIHHVKKFSKIVKVKNPFHIIMLKLRRKQLPVCKKCHKDIHNEIYDKNKSIRKAK